jgi:hypothetical protein
LRESLAGAGRFVHAVLAQHFGKALAYLERGAHFGKVVLRH